MTIKDLRKIENCEDPDDIEPSGLWASDKYESPSLLKRLLAFYFLLWATMR